jgi:hypothetical protein
MHAREVDEAASWLRELRAVERGRLGLAAVALALALGATRVLPALVLPLFFGGVAVGALGVRALWRRWDLVDRLAGERDAYVIPEVLAYASRQATLERRQNLAVLLRSARWTGLRSPERAVVAVELEALASELENADLGLDPACAVACARLLTDLEHSPLLNPALPPEELRSRVRQIRTGFTSRRPRSA